MSSPRSAGIAATFGLAFIVTLLTSCINWDLAKTRNKGLALVIGNESYQPISDLKTEDLTTPEEDAREVSKKLTDFGFEVIHKQNLTKDQMESVIFEFVNKLHKRPYRIALVYYSGHGIQVQGKPHLWPVDGNKREPDTLYSLANLMFLMKKNIPATSPTEGGIVILDACRTETDGMKGLKEPEVSQESHEGILVAYAARPGNITSAVPTERGLSLYTDALLQELSISDRTVKEILEAVNDNLRQIPWYSQSGPLQFKFDPIPRSKRAPVAA